MYSAAYGTVHYKEPLKSFKIKVGHSPGFCFNSTVTLYSDPRDGCNSFENDRVAYRVRVHRSAGMFWQ